MVTIADLHMIADLHTIADLHMIEESIIALGRGFVLFM